MSLEQNSCKMLGCLWSTHILYWPSCQLILDTGYSGQSLQKTYCAFPLAWHIGYVRHRTGNCCATLTRTMSPSNSSSLVRPKLGEIQSIGLNHPASGALYLYYSQTLGDQLFDGLSLTVLQTAGVSAVSYLEVPIRSRPGPPDPA